MLVKQASYEPLLEIVSAQFGVVKGGNAASETLDGVTRRGYHASSGHRNYRLGCRRSASKTAVWSYLVIVTNPTLSQDLDFIHVSKQFSVEKFVPHPRIETFYIAVFPGAPGLNVGCYDADIRKPFAYRFCCEFASIVTPKVNRCSAL